MKDLLMRHNPYFQGFILVASLSSVEVEEIEWGFKALIAMPTTHNEVYYRADVVRLEWLKRRRQPCRSGAKGKRSWARARKKKKKKKRTVSGEREWHWGKRRKCSRKRWDKDERQKSDSAWQCWRERGQRRGDNKPAEVISAFLSAQRKWGEAVIKALNVSDSDISPFCSRLLSAPTVIQKSRRCHAEW